MSVLKPIKRIYEGRNAVGFVLSDGKMYVDGEVIRFLAVSGCVAGLGLQSGRIVGVTGFKLSSLPKVQLQEIRALKSPMVDASDNGGLTAQAALDKAVDLVKKANLAQFYHGLDASTFVRVQEAHAYCLQYGFMTGCEMAIGVDIMTGIYVLVERSVQNDYVKWELPAIYNGRVIAVHNHPESSAFSAADLHTFGSDRRILSIAAHGNDGTVFVLNRIGAKDIEYVDTEKLLDDRLARIQWRTLLKREGVEKFARLVAKKYDWLFMKGE
jgi:hypothetical protein